MLKLKLQYFGHVMWRDDSLEKRPWCWERFKAGGEGEDRGWYGWLALLTWWTWVWVSFGTWWWTGKPGVPAVHGVTESWTWLSDFTFTFHFHALKKEMATHSSVLAWRIPGTGEPGGLPSMGSHRVGHDWSDLAAVAEHFLTPYTKINSKWVKDLNIRPETIKLLEENIGKTLSDIHHSKILYDPPLRILGIKAKIIKWGTIKIKSFCTTKESISKLKR